MFGHPASTEYKPEQHADNVALLAIVDDLGKQLPGLREALATATALTESYRVENGRLRKLLNEQAADIDTASRRHVVECERLREIIAEARKQQPKRYTESELRAEFEKKRTPMTEEFEGWLDCARFMGAIKE